MSFANGFLGDIDEAIDWLERAYQEHDAYHVYYNITHGYLSIFDKKVASIL